MLVVEIDVVGLQALERLFDNLFDVLRAAVQADGAVNGKTEFTRNRHLVAKRLKRFAHQFFVGIGAVHLRRVEKSDAVFKRRAKRLNALSNIGGWTVVGADAHASGTNGGDL